MDLSKSSSLESPYTESVDKIFTSLNSDLNGISTGEAEKRISDFGPNKLPKGRSITVWEIFLRQFKNPLIYILAIAAVVSFIIGEEVDAGFIALVLIINAVVGGIQEWQAERSSKALQDLIKTKATVVRDGQTYEVDSEDLVPGDIVILESGFKIPADIRLISTHNLEIDESSLTGESEPILKDENWLTEDEVPLGDRLNMCFAGTTVTRGRGKGIVVATGEETKVGQLAEDVTSVEGGKPPLVTRMERFTQVIGIAVLLAAALTAILGVFLQQFDTVEMFLFAVALAVSAIPEGLPVGVTVALGVASRRMAKVGVIVRRLVAVEGLGSCTMIASDKTGTLTANELTAKKIYLPTGQILDVTGEGYTPEGNVFHNDSPPEPDIADDLSRLVRASVLCNEGSLYKKNGEWGWRGDPTDIALLVLGQKRVWNKESALESHPKIEEIPFEPDQRYAATFHRSDNGTKVFVKGAPERILEMCNDVKGQKFSKKQFLQEAESMAKEGYRVLAIAEGTPEKDTVEEDIPSEPSNLTFLGFIGLKDPLRPGVSESIKSAQKAGITVTMITGDHPETALSIARDLGLAKSPDEVVTGQELVDASEEKIKNILNKKRVFARVSPNQKLKIVEAARKAGHFVAVTGDGVNDAPALRQANIGIAMGKMGTDVARDAAELVISDDNFSTIVSGIEQGRVAFDNIRKVIYLLISTGAGEVALVLLCLIAGLPLPLLPVQILWLNLVTNGIQDVALAFEPKEGDVLDRPPRPTDERIFNQIMIERTIVSSLVIGIVGFGAFNWLLGQGLSESAARNHLLLLIVLFEIVNIGNARSETTSLFKLSPIKSPILLTGTIGAFIVHLGAMYIEPIQTILETEPVDITQWIILGIVALTIAIAIEIHKITWKVRK